MATLQKETEKGTENVHWVLKDLTELFCFYCKNELELPFYWDDKAKLCICAKCNNGTIKMGKTQATSSEDQGTEQKRGKIQYNLTAKKPEKEVYCIKGVK